MSRVHDALRRAGQAGAVPPRVPEASAREDAPAPPAPPVAPVGRGLGTSGSEIAPEILSLVAEVPFRPAPEAMLIDSDRPQEAPSEEFRSVRTRLNHLQTLQPIHVVVVTSASPAEGKSFAAANLALSQAQLAGNNTLLIDFDFRRPMLHNLFQIERGPGASDYLLGQVPLHQAIRRVAGSNLYLMPAGRPVKNPLEMLNLPEVKELFAELPKAFNWVLLDSPPLLFSADANLLGTLADGIILVVRIGQTTIDTVHRSMNSLCENNVIGMIVNGARAGELYSKYTYYYSRHYGHTDEEQNGAPLED